MKVWANWLSTCVAVLSLGTCLSLAQAATTVPTAAKLQPINLTSFFITPAQPTVLSFQAAAEEKAKFEYQISDYWGRNAVVGTADPDGGVYKIRVNLKPGFYQISFPSSHQDFGIVAQPARVDSADPFFGMDSVLSWLEQQDPVREQYIQILHRSGIAISRERVGWGHINPTPDKWEWDAVDHYQTLREMYARNGLPILEMFHHAPRWVHSGPPTIPYPGDLVATAECWTTIARQWQPFWGALEIWNEPESNACGNWSAEQYIPTIRTLAFAFAQAGYHFPIGGGVFMGEDPGQYHDTCARNGMLDNVDFVGYHTYHGAGDMERHVGRYRQWLKAFGKETMPLWISESGEPWPAGTDRALRDDDARSAMEIAMKAVEARACGIARYFPFDLPFYVEGPRNFGMMGREGTPLRSMAAYVQCVAALSGQAYLGDLKVNGSVRRARVFGRDGRCTVVLYTGTPNADASLRVDAVIDQIEGVDGRVLRPNADGSIPVPDGLVYLRGSEAALAPLMKTDTIAAGLYAIAQKAPPKRSSPSPLVVQFLPEALPAMHGPDGYLLQDTASVSLPIHIRAWNLSNQVLTSTLSLQVPGKEGVSILAKPTTIPPRKSVEISWTVNAAKALDIEEYRYLTIADVSAAPLAPATLAIPLRLEGTLEQYLERHPARLRLKIDDLKAWDQNIAPYGKATFSVPAAGQWKMDLAFSRKTDEWVYPKFRLPLLTPGTIRGVLLRARAAAPAGVRLMVFQDGKATYWTSQPIIPADGNWHAAWVPVEKFDPLADINNVASMDLSNARELSVGMHNLSPSNANVLEVSDLFLIGDSIANR